MFRLSGVVPITKWQILYPLYFKNMKFIGMHNGFGDQYAKM